jgi:hypothetical protein
MTWLMGVKNSHFVRNSFVLLLCMQQNVHGERQQNFLTNNE